MKWRPCDLCIFALLWASKTKFFFWNRFTWHLIKLETKTVISWNKHLLQIQIVISYYYKKITAILYRVNQKSFWIKTNFYNVSQHLYKDILEETRLKSTFKEWNAGKIFFEPSKQCLLLRSLQTHTCFPWMLKAHGGVFFIMCPIRQLLLVDGHQQTFISASFLVGQVLSRHPEWLYWLS